MDNSDNVKVPVLGLIFIFFTNKRAGRTAVRPMHAMPMGQSDGTLCSVFRVACQPAVKCQRTPQRQSSILKVQRPINYKHPEISLFRKNETAQWITTGRDI